MKFFQFDKTQTFIFVSVIIVTFCFNVVVFRSIVQLSGVTFESKTHSPLYIPLNETISISLLIKQEWSSSVQFKTFLIAFSIDFLLLISLMFLNCFRMNNLIAFPTKLLITLIFVTTIIILFTGIIIHQDDPFGPMINVLTGIVIFSIYTYLTTSSLKMITYQTDQINQQEIKEYKELVPKYYSVI